jgi:hypothetical protein
LLYFLNFIEKIDYLFNSNYTIQKMYFSVALLFALTIFGNTHARIRRTNFVTSCHCAPTVSKERDIAYTKYNNVIKSSENIITINNCLPGTEFKYEEYENDNNYKIECKNCSDNYYRTSKNTSCIRCPVGYYSKSGDSECTKTETNISNVHTLCNKGYVSGNDKFAEYENSCYSCVPQNKEYMPYKSNHDSCFVCPAGSIVDSKAISCTECPIGYYEKNNTCNECDIGTYNDKLGAAKCNVCNNKNALAYNSVGGYNCDNSIFFDLTDRFKNNLIDMDMILKPMAYSANLGVALISNNRRAVELIIPSIAIIYITIITI